MLDIEIGACTAYLRELARTTALPCIETLCVVRAARRRWKRAPRTFICMWSCFWIMVMLMVSCYRLVWPGARFAASPVLLVVFGPPGALHSDSAVKIADLGPGWFATCLGVCWEPLLGPLSFLFPSRPLSVCPCCCPSFVVVDLFSCVARFCFTFSCSRVAACFESCFSVVGVRGGFSFFLLRSSA